MATRFHLSENGPAPCEAKPGNCPIGGDHFDNENSAIEAYEKKVEKEIHHVLDRIDEVLGGKDTETEKWDFSGVEKLGSVNEDATIEELRELRAGLISDPNRTHLTMALSGAINRQELFKTREYGSPLEAQMASDDFLPLVGGRLSKVPHDLREIDKNADISEELRDLQIPEWAKSEIADAIKSGDRAVGRLHKYADSQYVEIENKDGSTTVFHTKRGSVYVGDSVAQYKYAVEGNSVRLLGSKFSLDGITQESWTRVDYERFPDGSTVGTCYNYDGTRYVTETKPNGSDIRYTLDVDGKPNGDHIETDNIGKVNGKATIKDPLTGNILERNVLHGSNYCADSSGNPIPSFSRTTPDGRVYNSYKMGSTTLVNEELDENGNIFTEGKGYPVEVRNGETGMTERFFYNNGKLQGVSVGVGREMTPFPLGSKLVKDKSNPLKYSVVAKDGSILRETDPTPVFERAGEKVRTAGRNLFERSEPGSYEHKSLLFNDGEYKKNEIDPTSYFRELAFHRRIHVGPELDAIKMQQNGFTAVGG